ncbi:MAG: hypothetical protein HY608_04030 [Planctomycetes bacterium]|nr:hypothetical protein [Planctomycetota bacterium]
MKRYVLNCLVLIPLLLGCGAATPSLPERTDLWIEQLGDPDWRTREHAHQDLLHLGDAALPFLEMARDDADPERACRVETIWRILDRQRRYRGMISDPVLQSKIDEWRERNPGSAILATRAMQFQRGQFVPCTGDVELMMTLDGQPTSWTWPDHEGYLFAIVQPGQHALQNFGVCFVDPEGRIWRPWMIETTLAVDPFLILPDLEFVSPMRWSHPGGDVSLRTNTRITWEPCPEVRRVEIRADKIEYLPENETRFSGLGALSMEEPPGREIGIADLAAGIREIRAGMTVRLYMTGYDDAGREVSNTSRWIDVVVRE